MLYKKMIDVNYILSCYTNALDKERHLNAMRFNEACINLTQMLGGNFRGKQKEDAIKRAIHTFNINKSLVPHTHDKKFHYTSEDEKKWDERYAWVGQESLHRSRYGNLVRVEPALCYINMPMVHEHGVSFLNPAKMYALTGDRKSDAYDTGCWFHEDCKAHGLPTLPVSLDDYAVHMAHGSWKRTAKMVQQFIEDNRALWE